MKRRVGMGPGRALVGSMLLLMLAGAVFAGGSQAVVRTSSYVPSAQPEVPSCDPFGNIANFEFPRKPTNINKWLPLTPGTQYVLQGQANRGGGFLPHTITFTVTDLTKKINGVNVRVLWDVDRNENLVQEAELSFFAEDEDGNIWLFGEYPEEYDFGLFKGAPLTWIAGTDGAEAGVQVPGHPKLTGPSYIQGLAPSVGFFDCGKDFIKGDSLCVPVACYTDVYATEEWNPDDPQSGFQRKYYARGAGNISVGAVNDPEGETLVLAQINKLDKAAMLAAREEALKLDERAYYVTDAYRDTEPAQPGGKRGVRPPAPPMPPVLPPALVSAPPAGPTGPVTQRSKAKKKKKKAKRCRSSKRKAGSKKKGSSSKKRKRCVSKKRKGSSR
jgi:hypothetical protein